MFQLRVQHYVGDRLIHDHRMVDAIGERAFFYPDPAGRVRLWIHVYQQCRNISGRKTGGEIDGRSCLSDPAFLIGDRNDFSHMSISRRDELKVNDAAQIITSEMPSKSESRCSTWNGGTKRLGDDGDFVSSSPYRPVPQSPRRPVLFKRRFTWNGRYLLSIFG